MADTLRLIERAAALLRERDAQQAADVAELQHAPSIAPPATGKINGKVPAGDVLDLAALGRYGITLPSERRSRTAEEFRLIKQNLVAATPDGVGAANQISNRSVMVASALAGEGKTFVALNLALAFASAKDLRALLIDADSQHPLVPALFGEAAEKGIVDVLEGRCGLEDALLRTSLPRLSILPAGQGGPDLPELLSSRRMGELVSDIAHRYPDRYVVIDTPPCLLTSEAAALAPHVGQILFVVEAHRTQRQEIEAALNLLGGCPRISLLLNKSDRMTIEHFGSYGYYYYPEDSGEEQSEAVAT